MKIKSFLFLLTIGLCFCVFDLSKAQVAAQDNAHIVLIISGYIDMNYGTGFKNKFFVDDNYMGKISKLRFYKFDLPAGQHSFSVNGSKKAEPDSNPHKVNVACNLKGGKTYYLFVNNQDDFDSNINNKYVYVVTKESADNLLQFATKEDVLSP